MSKLKSKLEDIGVAILAALIILLIFLALFGVHYLWLNYTPCSFHTVKDAPVRCLKEK